MSVWKTIVLTLILVSLSGGIATAHDDHSSSTIRAETITVLQGTDEAVITLKIENIGTEVAVVNGFQSDFGIIESQIDWPLRINPGASVILRDADAIHLQATVPLPGIQVLTISVENFAPPITVIPTQQ